MAHVPTHVLFDAPAFGGRCEVQQELLRHADIRTTMNTYTQAMPAALPDANSKVARLVVR